MWGQKHKTCIFCSFKEPVLSACSFTANSFCHHIFFQEFVTVPLNPGEKTGSCNLTGLWDSTEYSVAVRCISVGSMFWSEWSRGKSESTEEKGRLTVHKVLLWLYFGGVRMEQWKTLFSVYYPFTEFRILLFKQSVCVLFKYRRGGNWKVSKKWRRFERWCNAGLRKKDMC